LEVQAELRPAGRVSQQQHPVNEPIGRRARSRADVRSPDHRLNAGISPADPSIAPDHLNATTNLTIRYCPLSKKQQHKRPLLTSSAKTLALMGTNPSLSPSYQ
jgi:hypothetical protein